MSEVGLASVSDTRPNWGGQTSATLLVPPKPQTLRLTLESNKGKFFQYIPTFLNLAYTKACGAAKLCYTDRIHSGDIEKISSRCLGIFSSYQPCLL